MAKVLVYYAHPGHRRSRINADLFDRAQQVEGVTVFDLYAQYPRFNIDIDLEQQRLLEHDIVVFQFPLFWYSTPSLIKEWCDLVLEFGFAYGEDGDKLSGKSMLLALTAGGTQQAYTVDGFQENSLRTFLTPLERTAKLCHMRFLPPYVLFGALKAPDELASTAHAEGYAQLLTSLVQDSMDFSRADQLELLMAGDIDDLVLPTAGSQS